MSTKPSSEESVRTLWQRLPTSERFSQTVVGKGVLGRARVNDLLKAGSKSALAEARKIEHPWYRCQALSSVAQAEPHSPQAEALLSEALDAAYSQGEPNRVASVAAWPLVHLVQVNPTAAADHTARLLKIIAAEPHGLRRLDGLCAILIAVVSSDELRPAVFQTFVKTADVCAGWRTERTVDTAIRTVATLDRHAALVLLISRPTTRHTRASRALLFPNGGVPNAQT